MSFKNLTKKNIITADGSPTIYIEELRETYHSKHGAITESDYVYIKKGVAYWLEKNNKNSCSIFEMGLGTGLNAYLTYVFSQERKLDCNYTSIENFPLTPDDLNLLQFKASLPSEDHHHFFDHIHQSSWEDSQTLHHFNFKKIKQDFMTFETKQRYDVMYYDAFGYHAQSDLWQEEALKISYDLLLPGGVWVSYCAKGVVRRALQNIGFIVERLEGPPGKREMLRAVKEV